MYKIVHIIFPSKSFSFNFKHLTSSNLSLIHKNLEVASFFRKIEEYQLLIGNFIVLYKNQ